MVRNKLYICKEYHIQPSEIDNFVYYEYEWILEEIKLIQKEQEKQQEQHDKDIGRMQSNMNPAKMMNSMKMPNMSQMSMPKMNIPKF